MIFDGIQSTWLEFFWFDILCEYVIVSLLVSTECIESGFISFRHRKRTDSIVEMGNIVEFRKNSGHVSKIAT